MSLLAQLRATDATPVEDRPPWSLTERGLRILVGGFEARATVIRGDVEVRGNRPGKWLIARLHTDREDGPPGKRLAKMSLGTSRDDVEENYYALPWSAWIDPEPGALAAWIAGIMLTARQNWPEPTHKLGRPRNP